MYYLFARNKETNKCTSEDLHYPQNTYHWFWVKSVAVWI